MRKKNDPTIMLVRPGAISPDDKQMLRDVGVIVIEIDNPQDAKLIRAGFELETGVLLNAAAKAVMKSDFSQKAFGVLVSEAIELQFKESKP